MSEHIARAALARMNLTPVALSVAHTSFGSDMRALMRADSHEEQQKFMEQRRTELCAAYGYMNVPEQDKPFAYVDGIAIIPVSGLLINRFGQSYGWVTGYNFIRQQTALALADDDVKGILYDCNSGGGEAAGCFEVSAFIREAGKLKPTMAYVDSASYSACYAIASACNKVVCTPSAGVGSIGVVVMHVDFSKFLAEAGVEVTFIHFGDHKVDGNPYEKLSPSVKQDIQKGVDKFGMQFAQLVATNRSMEVQAVIDTQARTYRADDALAIGLIDAVLPPEQAAAAFVSELSGSTSSTSMKVQTMTTETTQPGATQTPVAAPAAATPATAPTVAATPAAAPVAATPAAHPAAEPAASAADVRASERARMGGILNCEEAKGRESLANHFAMNTDMSVDAAKAALAAAPKTSGTAAGNPLVAAMAATGGGPNVGAEGAGGEPSAAQRIKANHALASGAKLETPAQK